MVRPLGLGKQITLKCLMNQELRSFNPDSGTAPIQRKLVSLISIFCFSFLSKINFMSTTYLSNSMGGLAPNCSFSGIPISSINITFFLPKAAPLVFYDK